MLLAYCARDHCARLGRVRILTPYEGQGDLPTSPELGREKPSDVSVPACYNLINMNED